VLGFLVELVQGRRAGPEDLQECRGVVQRRHAQDSIVHGDLNRHNFIVVSDGTVTLIDFEVAVLCGEVPEEGAGAR
jgi:RIO-like serine/threonine protein kinase